MGCGTGVRLPRGFGETVVEALDPRIAAGLIGQVVLAPVADEAGVPVRGPGVAGRPGGRAAGE